jgi:tetratricopeptide (TPR) repeat protein
MRENPYRQDREGMIELLQQYNSMKQGRGYVFLEEDAFEQLIDYFDEKDDLSSALEAAEYGIQQYPYSSILLIKKADLLIAKRLYREALALLEKAELLDTGDINLYILKTDVYLALDQQKKAADLLEKAMDRLYRAK